MTEQEEGDALSTGQRMEARYELSRRIAHDTKAPIRQIAQLTEILVAENSGSLDEDALSILSMVQDKARHLGEMTQAVRDYTDAMCKPLAVQRIDFTELLKAEIESLQFENVLFKCENPIFVNADPQFLRRIVQQLLKVVSIDPSGRKTGDVTIAVHGAETSAPHIALIFSPCSIDFTGKLPLTGLAQYKSANLFELLSISECSEIFLRHGWTIYMEKTGAETLEMNICL